MKNYIPRSKKINHRFNNKITKLFILTLLLISVIVLIFFTNSDNNSLVLDNQVFEGKYKKNKNYIKVEELKFKGYNNIGNPYSLTAKEAVKEIKNIDKVILHNVEADIFINEKNWFFLNTDQAIFLINNKTLFSEGVVKGFYDDGSSFSSPSIEFNFNSGIAQSKEGIVMFGKWGSIKADKFSFNSFKDIYRFDGKAVMIINVKND